MQTFTGRKFWPLDPRAEEVSIVDIAHSLSNQCRYAGHCKDFYSVAQHSVLVSAICDPEDALWGLLHDAAEAYLVDLPRPIKRFSEIGVHYKKAETALLVAISERFHIPVTEPASVKKADNVALMTEKRDLMSQSPEEWIEERTTKPMVARILPWSPTLAKAEFLRRFEELTK